jgi:exopolysaccharide biosynthesis polyprenyl glycosylphosphotransferase
VLRLPDRDDQRQVVMPPSPEQIDPTGPDGSARRGGQYGVPALLVPGARLLLALEATLPLLTLVAVLIITHLHEMPNGLDGFLSIRVTVKNLLLCAGFLAGWIAILRLCRVYERRALLSSQAEASRLIAACSVGTGLSLAFPLASINGDVEFHHLLYMWMGSVALLLPLRAIRRVIARRRHARAPRRVIIVGAGPRASRVWTDFTADSVTAYTLAGFVDADRDDAAIEPYEHPWLGTVDDLEQVLMQEAVDEVFIALPVKSHYREIQHAIEVCERVGVRTKYQAEIFATSVAWPRIEAGANPVVTMNVAPDDYRVAFKRAFDLLGALTGLILFSPVILTAALAIKLASPGPVLFAQERYGLNKRLFRMVKLRTMVTNAEALQVTLEERNEADGPVFKIVDDPRVTWIGRFLRKTSIDELPQLLNVLQGEMSLVGPRPLPVRDVQRFTRGSDMRRFSVRPGLTCLWQISGRNQLGFNEWVRLDLKYIDGWSLIEDFRILAMTIPAVLRGTGAN